MFFFLILIKLIDENNFDATTRFNVGESEFSTMHKRRDKILPHKCKKQVDRVSSGERDLNTTVHLPCCLNAASLYVSPR